MTIALDWAMKQMLRNSTALTDGKFENSRIMAFQAGDFSYWLDVSFKDKEPTIHDWRISEYDVEDVSTDIFDHETGEAYDQFRQEEHHANWVISHRE